MASFSQYYRTGIARVWSSLLREWPGRTLPAASSCSTGMTMDRVPGINYALHRRHDYENLPPTAGC